MQLLSLSGFRARVRFGDEPLRGEDRKDMAVTAWRRVSQQLRATS
jgi:hypothetical protein